jgi:hypothetical protein
LTLLTIANLSQIILCTDVDCHVQVMDKNGHLIDLADSALSGNVRIFGEIDPEWEVDPKSIVFQEKVRAVLGGRGGGGMGCPWAYSPLQAASRAMLRAVALFVGM